MSSITRDTDPRGIVRLTLNRPEVHNAFDDSLIGALAAELDAVADDPAVRVVILTGAGASFSAGGDLKWMRSMVSADEAANRDDSLRLAELMRKLNYLPKPTIAAVNGSAFGGGVGLISCCDCVIAVDTAKFALTEVRLGLAPAVISPYVVDAIGLRQARRLFQTAERIDASEARHIGLVHKVVRAQDFSDAIAWEAEQLFKAGPNALAEAKALAFHVAGRTEAAQRELDTHTAALIARLRVSPEGQEGCGAFLEKRKANWLDV